MAQESIEDWLPLRGRWLGYFWQGLRVLPLSLCVWCLAWMMPMSHRHSRPGPVGAAKAQINNFKTALELYRLDHGGKVPTTQQGLVTLIRPSRFSSDPRWNGPYLCDVTRVPLDPWQHTYVYKSPGPSGESYEITSIGADGKPGGEGDDEDIGSVRR